MRSAASPPKPVLELIQTSGNLILMNRSSCGLRASRQYLSLIGDKVRYYLHRNNKGLLEEEGEVERKTIKWLLLN